MELNLTNSFFHDCSTNTDLNTLMVIEDDFATWDFHDWNLGFVTEYMYVTDPPVLADWGNLYFDIKNLAFFMNGSTSIYN